MGNAKIFSFSLIFVGLGSLFLGVLGSNSLQIAFGVVVTILTVVYIVINRKGLRS